MHADTTPLAPAWDPGNTRKLENGLAARDLACCSVTRKPSARVQTSGRFVAAPLAGALRIPGHTCSRAQ